MKAQLLSCPTLCDPMDVAHQAPLSVEFSRQKYWSGLPFLSPGDLLPNPRIEPGSPACRQILYRLSHKGEESYKSKALKFFHADLTEGKSKLLQWFTKSYKTWLIAPVISSPSTHLPARSGLIMGCGLRM